jgi:hypothetical protein
MTAGGQVHDAGYATEVEEQTSLAGVLEEQAFGQCGHGNSVAAGRNVPRTKVADGRHAATFGYDGRHSQRERRREAALGIVPNGVTGTGNA